MKWLQHMTDAHDDEILKELFYKFKSDGYTAWWVTAELVGKVVKVIPAPGTKDGFEVTARFEAHPQVFADATHLPIDRLEVIYRHCMRRRRFTFKMTKDTWVINWPKILSFKDNYTEDLCNKLRRELGSSLEVTSRLHDFVAPSLKGIQGDTLIGEEGVQGEGAPDRVWELRTLKVWERMTEAPSYGTKRKHIRDWIRQGVSRRSIEEAPMMTEFQKMDFFDIGKELKRRSNGNGNHGNGHVNAGAKEVLGHFALKPGDLDARVKQRIADRDREEVQAARRDHPQDRGSEVGASKTRNGESSAAV